MIVSHLMLILHKKYSFISLCLKHEMWQKVAKFKGAENFRKALYIGAEIAGWAAQGGLPTRAHCLSAKSVTPVHRLMITAYDSCRINRGTQGN
jgi:hypothetical protein